MWMYTWVISHTLTFYISMVLLFTTRFSCKKLLISLMQCIHILRMSQKQAASFHLHSITKFAFVLKQIVFATRWKMDL